jgi:hypothetical protein
MAGGLTTLSLTTVMGWRSLRRSPSWRSAMAKGFGVLMKED